MKRKSEGRGGGIWKLGVSWAERRLRRLTGAACAGSAFLAAGRGSKCVRIKLTILAFFLLVLGGVEWFTVPVLK